MNTFEAADVAIAQVVRRLMREQEISQKRASELASIPRATLLRRLDGEAFKVPELRRLARLLGTSASAIIAQAEQVDAA